MIYLCFLKTNVFLNYIEKSLSAEMNTDIK